jgi:hypothetical protein
VYDFYEGGSLIEYPPTNHAIIKPASIINASRDILRTLKWLGKFGEVDH